MTSLGPDKQPNVGYGDFFHLPGEVRNHIYKFVLTQPRPLKCIRDNGVTRLFTEQVQSFSFPNKRRRLTREEMVSSVPIDYSSANTTVVYQEANQLKYVNRHLYDETKTLALRYNQLSFYKLDSSRSSVYLCARFLSTCALKHYPHIHTIILQVPSTQTISAQDESAMKFLDSFAQRNPHVVFRIHVPIRVSCPHFMGRVLMAALHLRADGTFVKHYSDDPVVQGILLRTFEALLASQFPDRGGRALPDNIRMVPADEFFDEVAFRDMCAKSTLADALLSTVRGGVETWVELVRGWFVDGF